MSKKIAWIEKYNVIGNTLVAKPGEYIDKEDLSYLEVSGIEYRIKVIPEQATWGKTRWGEKVWPVPEDFPDYRNSQD